MMYSFCCCCECSFLKCSFLKCSFLKRKTKGACFFASFISRLFQVPLKPYVPLPVSCTYRMCGLCGATASVGVGGGAVAVRTSCQLCGAPRVPGISSVSRS